LIYEHCGYFSLHGLMTAFSQADFDVAVADESFEAQFIWVEARAGTGRIDAAVSARQRPTEVRRFAETFADQYLARIRLWQERLARMAREGRRAVVWGGGSKGVSFLNVLREHHDIRYVVDVNPKKQGRYVGVTSQQVVSPNFLRTYPATDVIVMNPVYLDEVRSMLRDMGLDMRCAVV
jgi:hypothetical protein